MALNQRSMAPGRAALDLEVARGWPMAVAKVVATALKVVVPKCFVEVVPQEGQLDFGWAVAATSMLLG